MPELVSRVGEAHAKQWRSFVVAVLLVSLVVLVALSRGLTSAQVLVNNNSASAASFDIIELLRCHVAFSETL